MTYPAPGNALRTANRSAAWLFSATLFIFAAGPALAKHPVQQEVTRALAQPQDFLDVPADAPNYTKKTSGMTRDTFDDGRPAFVVRDGNYVSARWPGDAHTFAKVFAAVLSERG